MRSSFQRILASTGLSASVLFAVTPAFANFSGTGDGSSTSPFLISSCIQLLELNNQGKVDINRQPVGNQPAGSYYKLGQRIDCSVKYLSPYSFPITESGGAGWSGHLDGAGFEIAGFNINVPGSAGLFATLDQTSSVSNITISGTVTGGTAVGLLAGDGEGNFDKVFVNGSVTGDSLVGGMLGVSSTTINIDDCSSTAKVTGTGSYVGGLIGQVTPTSDACITTPSFYLRNSFATGNVAGNFAVGGLLGGVDAHIAIENSYASGTVALIGNNASLAGGFVGNAHVAEFSNCFSTGVVSGASEAAGFVGNVQVDDNPPPATPLPGTPTPCPFARSTFVNNFYDQTSTAQVRCVADDIDNVTAGGCTAVDANSSQPNYFLGNKTSSPLNVWDFAATWFVASNSTPELKDGSGFVIAIPTPTHGPAPATPTPTPTATSGTGGTTSVPTAIPNSTTLTGSITPPLSNVVVYLYNGSVAIGSTRTNASGGFSFSGTAGINYTAIAHDTRLSVNPTSTTLVTGVPVTLTGTTLNLKDKGCTVKSSAANLTASDASAKTLHALVATTGAYVVAHETPAKVSKVTVSTNKSLVASDKAFTASLNSSRALPTEILSCPTKVTNCKTVSYSSKISSYRTKLTTLLNETLTLDATLKKDVNTQAKFTASNDTKARRAYATALSKLSKVSTTGKQCR